MYYCPNCKENLTREKNKLICRSNDCILREKGFKISKEIPVLIPFGLDYCIFKEQDDKKQTNFGSLGRDLSPLISKLKYKIRKFFYGQNNSSLKNFKYLKNLLRRDSKVLIVGGGTIGSGMHNLYSFCIKENIEIESIDLYASEYTTVIADANYLPFKNNYFDIVIIQAVLEHVISPNRVVDQIFNVLKLNGHIYAETPFVQCVQEGPFDFTRFSHSGHRWLFKGFEEIFSGYVLGAFSSSLFIISYAISGLLRLNIVGIILRLFLTRICKFLDSLTGKGWNIDVACGCYFLGKKTTLDYIKKDSCWISNYYIGAQK